MKLLDKKEINKVKNLERRLEIDEGAKLAKRVDNLREISAKEQDNLLKFRRETIIKVKEDIDKFIYEKESLKNEISLLEIKKKELLEPLDKELEEINKKREEFIKFGQELNDEYVNFEQNKKLFEEIKISLYDEEVRISEERRITTKNLVDSESNKEHSQRLLSEAQEEQKRLLNTVDIIKRELEQRENNLSSIERDVKTEKQNIESEYKFIEEEKIRLADQRATLERALLRTKKQ